MSNALRLSPEELPVTIRYGSARTVNPTYPALLAVVFLVAIASVVTWFYGDFSLEARAERGEARAQYLLGKRYFDNAFSTYDYKRAATLIEKSAQQGYAKAQTGLGLLYENGLGVPKNYTEAVKWFRRAADQGYAVAQNELGVMYAKGRGVSKDMDEAARWCRLAAVQGSKVARKNLRLTQVANAKVMRQFTTATSKQTYPMATLQQVAADGVVVSFVPVPGGFGLARVKLEELPSDLRQICSYATKEPVASESAYSQIGAMATQL